MLAVPNYPLFLIVKMSRFHPKNTYIKDERFWMNMRNFLNNYAKRARFPSKNSKKDSKKGNFWSLKV